jgi:surface antigen
MLRGFIVTLAILAAFLASARPAPATHVAAPTAIVYGYSYAASCPGAGIAEVVDRWGMYECNCTSYVAWALAANHQRTDWFIRGSMDAWNWPHVALLAHLTVDRVPTVGAVAVWPELARPFGHVAYVAIVHSRRLIDVAEYNLPGPRGAETFDFETRSFVRVGDAVFIHVPRRRLSER